jgi:hypothetical protein
MRSISSQPSEKTVTSVSALEQAMLKPPVWLADPQQVAGRLHRRDVRGLVRGVRHDEQDVDDRFGGEARHRGGPGVLDEQGTLAERPADPVGLALEEARPLGVVLDQANRTVQQRRRADPRRVDLLLGHRDVVYWRRLVWHGCLTSLGLPSCSAICRADVWPRAADNQDDTGHDTGRSRVAAPGRRLRVTAAGAGFVRGTTNAYRQQQDRS